MSTAPRLIFNWKDPANVAIWRREFEARRQARTQPRGAYDDFVARSLDKVFVEIDPHDAMQTESESILERARRLEKKTSRKFNITQVKHNPPKILARAGHGGFFHHPLLERATSEKIEKAERLYDAGLVAKAQRELACGILGGEVHCENGCTFLAAYRCGNRSCVDCGPDAANRLFAAHVDPLRTVAQELMRCGIEECGECEQAIKEKTFASLAPPQRVRARVWSAPNSISLSDTKKELIAPDVMRNLNDCIKKFFRALERGIELRDARGVVTGKLRLNRREYGIAYCDELGGDNDNPHAHAVYVGPWLPNGRKGSDDPKHLSILWEKITQNVFPGSRIVSIKYARNKKRGAPPVTFAEALYHACKYPAKFAQRSSPKRLAFLEVVFHRVRRFHALARFYNPKVPKIKPEPRKCPSCGGRMLEWFRFEGLLELRARGLRDVRDVQREVSFARANAPPVKHD